MPPRRTVLLQSIQSAGTSGGTAPSAGQVAYWTDSTTLGGFGSFNSSTSALTLPGPLNFVNLAVKPAVAWNFTGGQQGYLFSDSLFVSFGNSTTDVGEHVGLSSTSHVVNFQVSNTSIFDVLSSGTRPATDNALTSGDATHRWNTVNTVNIANGTTGTVTFGGSLALTNAAAITLSAGATVLGGAAAGLKQVFTDFTDVPGNGDQTINKMAGNVNFASAATAITVTNSLVTTSTKVFAVAASNDATGRVANVTVTNGAFTINAIAPANQMHVNWFILNV